MTTRILISIIVIIATACTNNETLAQGGAVPIRIAVEDGGERVCINPHEDMIWLTLRRVITNKSKGWLKKDKAVGVCINASVKTIPKTPQPISFPLLTDVRLQGFSNGQVSVPIEYTIVDGLRLRQDDVIYTSVGLELMLLNKQGRTGWGKALQALAEVSKNLPIPSTPVTQASSYLLKFANTAISKEIEAQNSDDKAKSGLLAINFDPTGRCAGGAGSDFETTGTIAVLQESGIEGSGYIPISQTNEYCWKAELRPAFVLHAVKKTADLACSDASYQDGFKQVTNNYTAFFLNAVPVTGVLAGASEEAREAAYARCEANGVEASDCFGSP